MTNSKYCGLTFKVLVLSLINQRVLSFAPTVSSARIVVLPSRSRTPPNDDQEALASLNPSYWLISVLKRMYPFLASDGFCASVPAGMARAVSDFTTVTSLVDPGLISILVPGVDLIWLFSIKSKSLIFKDDVVFNSPAVWMFPVDCSAEIKVPIATSETKFVVEVVTVIGPVAFSIFVAVKVVINALVKIRMW